MKLSNVPTGWLMVNAFIQSEWDSVDFILLDISNPVFNNFLREIVDKAKAFKDDPSFYCLSYWSDNAEWYTHSYKDDGDVETPQLKDNWSYVTVTKKEIDKLKKPENALGGGVIKAFASGFIRFTNSGEHTGEQLWSDDIKIDEILNESK